MLRVFICDKDTIHDEFTWEQGHFRDELDRLARSAKPGLSLIVVEAETYAPVYEGLLRDSFDEVADDAYRHAVAWAGRLLWTPHA